MTDTRAGAKRPSLASLLVLAGALAGLFAMHGLSDHGAAPVGFQHAHAQVVSTSHMSGAVGEDHMAGMSADADEVTPFLAAAMTSVGSSSGAAMGLMGLCLAVLAGALLSLVRHHEVTGLVVQLARELGCLAAAIGTTSRERDPPCLTQLSILRC